MSKVHENDDIWYALDNNATKMFQPEQIEDIVAEVPGQNDEFNWWWILKLGIDKYVLVSGWCDYTGWDCQSGVTEYGIFNSPMLAAEAAPDIEEYSNRAIKPNLVAQLRGEYPKFTYWGE